eukprot:365578-Chlamydomonas_euryale.AAC.21
MDLTGRNWAPLGGIALLPDAAKSVWMRCKTETLPSCSQGKQFSFHTCASTGAGAHEPALLWTDVSSPSLCAYTHG